MHLSVYYTISILLTYINGNKTVSVLAIRVQCSKRLTEHSTSVQNTSKLFSSPAQHFVPRQLLNPLNPELNPICYLLALLAHHFLHVSRIRVKSLTIRLLMSYIYIFIYMEHLFLMFLDHTQRRTTVGRTSLDEWSARRRDLFLIILNTPNRQTCMSPVGFEPIISAGERPQTHPLARAATGTGN